MVASYSCREMMMEPSVPGKRVQFDDEIYDALDLLRSSRPHDGLSVTC
jgi:hypothetical protein